jgi:hypothetical protein
MTQTNQPNRLVEGDPVVRLASHPTALRALVALTNARGEALTVAQIARMGNFSKQSWYGDVEELLLDLQLIEPAERVANAQTFRVRMDTAAFDAFKRFRTALVETAGDVPASDD